MYVSHARKLTPLFYALSVAGRFNTKLVPVARVLKIINGGMPACGSSSRFDFAENFKFRQTATNAVVHNTKIKLFRQTMMTMIVLSPKTFLQTDDNKNGCYHQY